MKQYNMMSFYSFFLICFISCGSTTINSTEVNSKNEVVEESMKSKQTEPNVLSCNLNQFDLDKKVLISKNGKETKFSYDLIYYDKYENNIFLFDKKDKLIVLDLCSGQMIFDFPVETSIVKSMYKLDQRYFIGILCDECDDLEVWEIEFDLERLEVTDLNQKELEPIKALK